MTVFKLDFTDSYTESNALLNRSVAWLTENVNPMEYVKYGQLPIPVYLRHAKRERNKRRQQFFKMRNEFVHQTGIHLIVSAMSTYKGKGWRIYSVAYVKIEETDTWTVHSAEYDVFVKIFNDTTALQYKLAVL